MPRALAMRPKLMGKDAPYYLAFHSCSRSRPMTMVGAGAIPISEVCAYCQLVGIASVAERSKYLNLLQDMDQIWLDHQAKKQPSKK